MNWESINSLPDRVSTELLIDLYQEKRRYYNLVIALENKEYENIKRTYSSIWSTS